MAMIQNLLNPKNIVAACDLKRQPMAAEHPIIIGKDVSTIGPHSRN